MTWQNALFVGAGTAFMALVEWGRHRYERQRKTRRKTH